MAAEANEEQTGALESNETLTEAARAERDYVCERLRAELGREPTTEEINDWLRQHTEGY
jgi:DNA-directed RNA polymerase specialized sigma subunit